MGGLRGAISGLGDADLMLDGSDTEGASLLRAGRTLRAAFRWMVEALSETGPCSSIASDLSIFLRIRVVFELNLRRPGELA